MWSVRSSTGERVGLTIYQVQELLRSGALTATDEASDGGEWKQVGEFPQLAKMLPPDPAAQPEAGNFIHVAGMQLRIGEDGKPLPPTPEEIALMLAVESSDIGASVRKARRWITFGAMVITGILMVIAFQMLLKFLRQ
jgi:hypothetical protein